MSMTKHLKVKKIKNTLATTSFKCYANSIQSVREFTYMSMAKHLKIQNEKDTLATTSFKCYANASHTVIRCTHMTMMKNLKNHKAKISFKLYELLVASVKAIIIEMKYNRNIH